MASTNKLLFGAVAVGSCAGVLAYRLYGNPSNKSSPKLSREEALTHVDPRVRLAQCLSDKGYKLYGTSWCGWCNRQKEAFGPEGQHLISYIDCTRDDGKHGFKPECMQLGIRLVPSWSTPDGRVLQGTQTLESLAVSAGCNNQ